MKPGFINGPSGMVIETRILDEWKGRSASGVVTNFGTFLRNPHNKKLEWVRDSSFVLSETATCPPSSNESVQR
jgi:hypothetical protein